MPRSRSFGSAAAVLTSWLALATAKPNVLFLLTDDQDITLGSLKVMPKLQKLVTDQGAFFSNAFVNTPICCPSRSEIQTGRYMHNTHSTDNACGGELFRTTIEPDNVANFASKAGYRAYYSGKYLNNYGSPTPDHPSGVSYVPPGWSDWHALVGNSKYYNYEVSNNGSDTPIHHGNDYGTDYYTDVLKNESTAWLKSAWNPDSGPFFMMIGTPCPHVPNVFAPQYSGMYRDVIAPRNPNWNVAPANATGPGAKHWFLQHVGPMDPQHVNNSDMTFQDRWRCLQSVDDMVEDIVGTLDAKGQWNNTFFIYSSDHGQHLGEFGMGFDKRQLYETDIRVPLLVRGPGIEPGIETDGMASHIDLAVTMLDMMGVARPSMMDGTSWLPLVVGTAADRSKAISGWRHDLLIEYNGPSVPTESTAANGLAAARAAAAASVTEEFRIFASGGHPSDHRSDAGRGVLPKPPASDDNCGMPVPGHTIGCEGVGMCGGEHGMCPCDAVNNTYKCLRTINASENSIFCEFDDSVNFVEYYDLNADPYELHNIATSEPSPTVLAKMAALRARLRSYMRCWGPYCFNPPVNPPPAPPPPAAPTPPPSPIPPGMRQFEKDGLCLSAATAPGGGGDDKIPVGLTACAKAAELSVLQVWNDAPIKGEPTIKLVTGVDACLNLNEGSKACSSPPSQTSFHLFQCPGGAGNRLRWNSTYSAIELMPSVCGGAPRCITAEGNTIQLGVCGGPGATGWVRTTTTGL